VTKPFKAQEVLRRLETHLQLSRLNRALVEKNSQLETARQAAEEARALADEANKAKSRFLANMSHELRTPLNAIIGYSEMVEEELEEVGVRDVIPDLQRIQAAARHQLGLVNDILDLSKIEAGKMTLFLEDFDVGRLVNEVASTVQPLIAKNGNRLLIECPPGLGIMRADQTKVRQTLFNLLSNASKFTEKGTIMLRVARVASDECPVTSGARHTSLVTFSVTDTGIGMTAEQLGRLFQAFSQAEASTATKYGGTGLGLVLSRRFCQLMGGDLGVTSEPGKGSTFTATLPGRVGEAATS
jgi:signal transduction histidine kinase